MPKSLEVIVTGGDELVKKLANYPTAAKAAEAKGLRLGILVLVREVKETIYAGHAAGHLDGDSGHLWRSIVYQVGDGEAEMGTNLIYAPPHEFGAVIKAKNAPYLMFQVGKSQRISYNKTTGAVKPGKMNMGWVRVKQVTIPARPYLRPAIANKGAEAAAQVTNALYEVLRP